MSRPARLTRTVVVDLMREIARVNAFYIKRWTKTAMAVRAAKRRGDELSELDARAYEWLQLGDDMQKVIDGAVKVQRIAHEKAAQLFRDR